MANQPTPTKAPVINLRSGTFWAGVLLILGALHHAVFAGGDTFQPIAHVFTALFTEPGFATGLAAIYGRRAIATLNGE